MASMNIPHVEEHTGVFVIDTKHIGNTGTIATFLVPSRSGDSFLLVETGPSSTLDAIEEGIHKAGFEPVQLDAILLTHIHLDHAGATGTLVERYDAHVYVHTRGAKHMLDPSRLMDSARRIYQTQMDFLWGDMQAVPADKLSSVDDGDSLDILGHNVNVLYTPGHASHHVSFHFDNGVMFTGDSAGAKVKGSEIVRPTLPPPEINLEVYDQSLANHGAQPSQKD